MAETEILTQKRVNNCKNNGYSGNYFPTNILGVYLKEISKINPLKKEEEHVIGKKIQKGDQESFNELVKRNLKYVVTVAKVFKGCGLSLSDLINEGNIGLLQAARRFDPFRNIKFITYANWWIRQAIMHAIAEQAGVVRLPVKQASILHKINKKYRILLHENERKPTSEELAKVLDISVENVESILRVYRTHLSLNRPLKQNEGTHYLDLLESNNNGSIEKNLLINSLKHKIEELLKKLTPREEKIIRLRFGFNDRNPLTLEEIGKEMRISRERVRQIEKKAKQRLRSKNKINILKEYLN